MNSKLQLLRRALESQGFWLTQKKWSMWNISSVRHKLIPQVAQYRYLGSVLQIDREIEREVTHNIELGE